MAFNDQIAGLAKLADNRASGKRIGVDKMYPRLGHGSCWELIVVHLWFFLKIILPEFPILRIGEQSGLYL